MFPISKCGQLLSARLHHMKTSGLVNIKMSFNHTQASPCNVEELAASEKVGFSSLRHREMSSNVSIAQISSVFAAGFMSNQLSSSRIENEHNSVQGPFEVLSQLENYEGPASISLDAITQTNVPEPFSVTSGNQQLDSHLDMAGLRQRIKFTAGDLQGTLFPGRMVYSPGVDGRVINNTTIKLVLRRASDPGLSPLNRNVHGLCTSQSPSAWNMNSNIHLTFQPTKVACSHYSTAANKEPSANDQKKASSAQTWKAKFKLVVAQYGPIAIVFHVAISLTSLGFFYLAVVSGLDVPGLLAKFQSTFLSTDKLTSSLATGATTFTVAYAIHKVFAPVRITITVFCVPYIARYLRRVGVLKKPPS